MRNTNLRWLFSLLLFSFVVPGMEANAQVQKSKLKVLYVGGSTNIFELTKQLSIEERKADVKMRMASFEGMLKNYFEQVTVIHAKDYKAELSAAYDVTVMDGIPGSKQYTPDFDPTKRPPMMEKVNVLPEDFSEPMLFIAEQSVNLGANIGLKYDWYCLCLEDDALNMRMEHEIFKGPFPVKITTSLEPLPLIASFLNYRVEKPFPDKIPMWKVQTSTISRPGLICRPGGFEDSPDAEYISGGTSGKEGNALAVGRHGNYFHWGFAASPEYLTEEAKTVLANAIVYISKFRGQKPIARKYSDRIKTTYDIVGKRDVASVKANELSNWYNKEMARRQAERIKKAQEKKATGEKLTEGEEELLKSETKASEPMDLPSFLKMHQGPMLFTQLGTDPNAYTKYYDENMPYFYSNSIDEDLKSLKIKKGDIKLLDVAIKMLETGQDVEKAKRILDRYTLATFTKPEEWRAWYNKNKTRFFFTESGGYKYLINTYENVEGNDYNKKAKKTAYQKITPGETTDKNFLTKR